MKKDMAGMAALTLSLAYGGMPKIKTYVMPEQPVSQELQDKLKLKAVSKRENRKLKRLGGQR